MFAGVAIRPLPFAFRPRHHFGAVRERFTFPSGTKLPSATMEREKTVMGDGHLERFVAAQTQTYDLALAEVRSGRKRSHWMWFIFPQLAGLGSSDMACRYAIRDLDEARAYLAHPVLGPRLRVIVAALQDLGGTTAVAVFGEVDAMKLRSSLTLFTEASGEPIFSAALERWFAGKPDERTLALLSKPGSS